jgi:hypothetical protein
MSVYVGIDVHRKRSQVAVVAEDGTVQLNKNVVNGSEPRLRLIGDLPAEARPMMPAREPAFSPAAEQERTEDQRRQQCRITFLIRQDRLRQYSRASA